MKIVLLVGNGGSGGLKAYIKGLLSVCYTRPNDLFFVITSPSFFDNIKEICSTNKNINIIQVLNYDISIAKTILFNKLPDDVISVIDSIQPDVVFHMNSIIHQGTENYFNIVGFHNQLYIDKVQRRRQKFGKTRIMLSFLTPLAIGSLKVADLVVFDSVQSRQQAIELGIEMKHSITAYFGVDKLERSSSPPNKCELSNPIKLLYISTLYPYKNQVELIEGIYELSKVYPNITLDLVGSGSEEYTRKIIKKIRKRKLEDIVILRKWIEHKKIADIIDSCDIFLYASSIETSGFGLMEAMARGAVIACNRASCLPEVLRKAGVLFDINDPKDISEKILMLIKDSGLRNALSQEAYDISEDYNWENHLKYVLDQCDELIISKKAFKN